MVDTGIQPSQQVIDAYNGVHKQHKLHYIICHIEKSKTVEVESACATTTKDQATFDAWLESNRGDEYKMSLEEAFAAAKDDGKEEEWIEWDWDEFCEKITKTGEPRFAVVDFHYRSKKLDVDKKDEIFVSWTPESSKPKDKMLYASTKEGLKQKFEGCFKSLQANEDEQLEHESVRDNVAEKN